MAYTYALPESTAFTGVGMEGYLFGPLRQRDLDVYYIESVKGHDTFIVNRKIARTYYVLVGTGYFIIDGRRYEVGGGMLVEVPPKVEYTYSGKMTMLAFSRPRGTGRSVRHTRWNPDVTCREESCLPGRESRMVRVCRMTIGGKSPVGAFLRLNRWLWQHFPPDITSVRLMSSYGRCVHALAKVYGARTQALNTYFLRNRSELELVRHLLKEKGPGEMVRVAVLGCSFGPEAYSVAWSIRSARPDLRLILTAVDISPHAVAIAQRGAYSTGCATDFGGSNIFERMTAEEREEFFDWDGQVAAVKRRIREGITWRVGDVGEPEILRTLGPQDMVFASNFLCHMIPSEAERCLRNIGRLVRPSGYLFVSGVDLKVRTKVARELEWEPVEEMLDEIHEGDPVLRVHWPWHYTGLEPVDRNEPDWKMRYAAAFRLATLGAGSSIPHSEEVHSGSGSTVAIR